MPWDLFINVIYYYITCQLWIWLLFVYVDTLETSAWFSFHYFAILFSLRFIVESLIAYLTFNTGGWDIPVMMEGKVWLHLWEGLRGAATFLTDCAFSSAPHISLRGLFKTFMKTNSDMNGWECFVGNRWKMEVLVSTLFYTHGFRQESVWWTWIVDPLNVGLLKRAWEKI